MLFIESNGFDGDVYIIAQLNGKFQDYTLNYASNFTMAYSAFYGTAFFLPSAYDFLVYFQPVTQH